MTEGDPRPMKELIVSSRAGHSTSDYSAVFSLSNVTLASGMLEAGALIASLYFF